MAIQQLAGQVWGGLPRTGGRPAKPAAAWQRTAQPGGGQGIQQPQGGQAGSGLGAMMGMFAGELANAPSVRPMQYGAGAWNILDPSGQQGAPQPAQPMQVSTGISQPADIPQPVPGGMPAPMEGLSPVAAQSAQSGLAQALQPMQAEAMEEFYTGTAGLQDAFQRSRAQAGLGWGQMVPQLANLQTQGQGNLLRFLSGMA